MNNKQTDENLFKKLEKIFGFNKKNEQIFVPKELAQQLIYEDESNKSGRKPIQTIVETPVVKVKSTKKITSKPEIKSESINLFDLSDISDVDPKINVKTVGEHEKDFASRIFNIFDIAKSHGIKSLSVDQITGAYYKVYSANNKDSIKTKAQITNKMYYMDFYRKKNARNAHVVKVADANCTYTISDYK